jgi:DNA-binding Lrp family transcriptional regulator
MTQLSKVAKHLRRNSTGAGITVAALAKAAGVPKTTVYKRVSDLRVNEGKTIYSNYRMVNGERKLYYRIAS